MTKKKKVKINKQKLFCFTSFIFLLICILWYGGRTIYFYLDSKKAPENNNNTIYKQILKNSTQEKNFKKVNKDYYFQRDTKNNYLTYSNIIWRIIKLTNDNEIVLITEEPITLLAYGNNKINNPLEWMNKTNKDNTKILEKNIDNINNYLTKTKICLDNIENVKNITCENKNDDYYFSLLDINDYIHTGASKSFINNGYYNYLINKNNDEIWYINSEGELNTTDGTDIYGIKPVITLKANIEYKKGEGTKDSPYIIEDKNQYFASYVKLDKDLYRVYDVKEDILKISLNDYLKVNNEKMQIAYSNNNYYHNDTTYNTLAHYLNNKYYNSNSYKNLILQNYYYNYYYGESNNYDYKEILNKKIDTKIYILSIADPILNNLNNYFIATGTNNNNNLIYIKESDGTLSTDKVTTEKNIVPCISINKNNLTKGSGTITDPYRTE